MDARNSDLDHAGAFAPGRWAHLARGLALEPTDPVCVALSGGADSVYLLHLVARAEPRPRILAVHVDHGLRGAESEADARFSADLARQLGVEFALRAAALERDPAGLETRARAARYAELASAARAADVGTILTAHHADDALETLILRWVRGSDLAALPALRPRLFLRAEPAQLPPRRPSARESLVSGGAALVVARPLLAMRRAEIRSTLAAHGLAWREDASNFDRRFARNAVRNGLLPAIEAECGPGAIENLHAFGRVVAQLEDRLAGRTAELAWSPARHLAARRAAREHALGGTLPRSALARLARPLARRALARLLAESTAQAPSRAVLDRLVADLFAGRTGWHELSGGWRLQLRADRLDLEPPGRGAPRRADPRQLLLPFPAPESEPEGYALDLPGRVELPDGRRLTAQLVRVPGTERLARAPVCAELDAAGLSGPLTVRWPRPGDRFHPLGAPGSKPLVRFLADVGVPRHDRARVPLVFAGDELVWVAGVRPCEPRRVRPTTRERVRLVLSA